MPAPLTRIFIVDDHQMVIDGLKLLIGDLSGFEIVGESSDPTLVVAMLQSVAADVLLTDVSMPNMSGIELSRQVKRAYPDMRILALSMHNDSRVISEMIDAGATGFILKNTGKQELAEALNKVAEGIPYYGSDITEQLVKSLKTQQEGNHLTDREIEIIRLIEKEFSNKQIADMLFISERTIETHRKNIFRKTNTQTIVGLLKYAYERKIV